MSTLVTLTAPSCGGKSYLFEYIRDVAKLPCLISTTTRAPRANEVDGLDYFFISEEESLRLEKEDQLAELAIYNGVRYGVTKQEFHSKLNSGPVAFLIVEPSGIEHYAKPAVYVGARHVKVWIYTPLSVRLERFEQRSAKDLEKASMIGPIAFPNMLRKTLKTILKRHETMLIDEREWRSMADWDLTVYGKEEPLVNLNVIMNFIKDTK